MRMIKRKSLFYLLMLVLFGIGFLLPWLKTGPGVKLGENFIPCNPKAKIDPNKIYHLRLWDYNWPIQGKSTYRYYLHQVIQKFQRIYPNIKIDFKLLELDGNRELIQALNKNEAPDVYCSAYTIPVFNVRKQIPVGPYLNKEDLDLYFTGTKKILKYQQILCYFPRWIEPEFWIGNGSLIEASGISVSKIQNDGWTWDDLSFLCSNLRYNQYLLSGKLGPNGLVSQLMANAGQGSKIADFNTTLDIIETLKNKKAIPIKFGSNMLGRFLNQKVILLAGLRTPTYKFLLDRIQSEKLNWQPVLLPIPSKVKGKGTAIIENGVISIYRNRYTKGYDHLAAAVKFGQYLSSYPDISPWQYLGFCPASKEAFRIWKKHISPNEQLYDNLFSQSNFDDYKPFQSDTGKIISLVNDLIAGKVTKQEILSMDSNK